MALRMAFCAHLIDLRADNVAELFHE